jgi:enoyl-CoA hydratase/carnithine racemase
LLSGRVLTAAEALDWGIVNRVVAKEELLDAAAELAGAIAALAPMPLTTIKRIVQDGLELPLEQALTLEQDETAKLIVTDDALEGIAAFVEKRPARFPGREGIARQGDT